MKVIVLSLFIAAVSASPVNFESRVSNGVKAVDGEFPYVFFITRHGLHMCSGTSITNTWILTAAQCIYLSDPSIIAVFGGSVDLNPIAEYVLFPIRLVVYPEYYSDFNVHNNDAGLIEVPPNPYMMHFIALPSSGIPAPGTEVTSVGWGITSTIDLTLSKTLRKGYFRVANNVTCRAYLGIYFNDNMICANSDQYIMCDGDKGGPLILNNNNNPIQYGILSFPNPTCANPTYPGYYTLTSAPKIFNWINETTNGNITVYNP